MNAIHFLHVLVALIFLLCMKTSSSESESLIKNGKMMARCIGKERKALLLFKQGIANKHNFIESWNKEEEDCCQWERVVCDNHTGHVTQLHLSSLISSYDSSTSFSIGSSLLDLPYLYYLDLRGNNLTEIPEFIGSLTKLVHLDLSDTIIGGSIPYQIGNLSNLQYLDLSENDFNSSIPKSIGSLNSLTYLYLSFNHLYGVIPHELGNLSKLLNLDLSNNHLSGSLPDFTGFSSLRRLHLEYNAFSGSIPDFTGCLSLITLRLNDNQLTEWKTESIGLLSSLYKLDVSMNSIRSTISEAHLSNLSSLRYLNTSFNPLKFELNSEWLPPFQLRHLIMASCKLGPKFPNWIRNQSELNYLDMSNTQISDTIPLWFWNISDRMMVLNLSSNKIRGKFSPTIYDNIQEIDLSSNYFDGPLPAIPSKSVQIINLSQNKFSGTLLPLTAGKDLSLRFLDISHNQLFGVIPDYWMHFEHLVFLNLGYNNLAGTIPKSIGHLVHLQTLIMRNNKLYGELPIALRNCTRLGFVDFGLNKLSGKVPSWIGEDLPNLYALILKSNSFYEKVPHEICLLSNLHFLDLSINKISGTIPPCFDSFTAMIQKGTQVTEHGIFILGTLGSIQSIASYYDNVLASWKGHELEYGRNFAFLNMIDLSSNELTGEIPIEITRLVDLKGLNLSANRFHGKVPSEIGRLKELECLDLSTNQFSGEIPASMTGLNFLSYLDLSNNNLTGRIPSGTQLQSFNISAYEGNTGLCGKPLTTICPGDDEPNNPPSFREEENGDDITEYDRWFYISAVLGFSTTFWGIIGTLILNRNWRHAYFLFLNNLKERLFVAMAVRIARLQRSI